MSEEIVQIKLLNGSEILCTFCEGGQSVDEFRVHTVLEMIPLSEPEDLAEVEQYMLRPFVTYCDDLSIPVSLNPVSVLLVAAPAPAIRSQYKISAEEIQGKLVGKKKVEELPTGNVVSFNSRKQILTED